MALTSLLCSERTERKRCILLSAPLSTYLFALYALFALCAAFGMQPRCVQLQLTEILCGRRSDTPEGRSP